MWLLLVPLAFAFVAGALLAGAGYLKLPTFGLLETEGAIYVDSPEIYTRERLVNDRYDQDYWLREQLKALDSAKNLLSGTYFQGLTAGVALPRLGARGNEDGGDAPGAHPEARSDRASTLASPSDGLLSFAQEFRLKAAIRDTFRQLLLENMLDDRHDLTGNSVFGLKFDTTVIPGDNTRKRAFVRVSLTADALERDSIRDRAVGDAGSGTLPSHVTLYYDSNLASIRRDKQNPLYKYYNLYDDWLKDMQFRLNAYVSDYCRAGGGTEDAQEISLSALEDVLGTEVHQVGLGKVNERRELGDKPSSTRLVVPAPWSGLLEVVTWSIPGVSPCRTERATQGLSFEVGHAYDSVYIVEKGEGLDWGSIPYFPLDRTDDDHVIAVGNPFGPNLTGGMLESLKPKYPKDGELPDLIEYASRKGAPHEIQFCAQTVSPGATCPDFVAARVLGIPSGLFNFIDAVVRTDAYTYAIFPKTDVVGILSESAFSGTLNQGAGGGGDIGGWLKLEQRQRETATPSVLIGYGDGANSDDKLVRFGWVLSGHNGMEPVQKTEMALVSVPAWTSELVLVVKTGWLDRHSQEQVQQTTRMRVPVPPDLESFDSVVIGGQARRRPKILDVFLGDVRVGACRSAEILIPGYRLWRSTAVTMGAQKAERIVVLPNMQGIIAVFENVDVPTVKADSEGYLPVKLRVWTSEGMSVARNDVQIAPPDEGYCERADPEKEKASQGTEQGVGGS